MNVCFIEDTPVYGGGQEWAVDTMAEFKGLKHEVNLIVPESNSIMIEKSKLLDVNIFTYDWDLTNISTWENKCSWIKALKNSDAVICSVHPPRNTFHCTSFAAECIKESGSRAVLLPKTGTIVPSYIKEYYLPDPEINTEIIAITAFTKNYLVNNYLIPEDRIEVLYQGTNIDKFQVGEATKEESLRRYPLPNRKYGPVLGLIGSFEERKGHVVLLKAIKRLKETSMPNILAMFVGKGPDEFKLKKYVDEFKLHDSILFFPHTNEPNYVYEQLDMLVLPSLYKEGLPNVILEAMSMGIPCIASRLAGTPELIHDNVNGFLLPPGNVELLASRIESLWSDKEKLKSFSKNARELVRNNFNRKTQAYKYSTHIEKVINKYR